MAKKALQLRRISCRMVCFSNRAGFVWDIINIKAFGEIVKIGD
jgi:hypothetical protein